MTESEKFQLWSNKHGKWWRPGALGYTDNQDEAGWFGAKKALGYLISSSYGSEPGKPGLVLVNEHGMRFTLELQRPSVGPFVVPAEPEQPAVNE